MERHDIGLHRQRDGHLIGDHLVDQLAADREIRVADRSPYLRQALRNPVGPTQVAAVRTQVVAQTFGEGVAQAYESGHPCRVGESVSGAEQPGSADGLKLARGRLSEAPPMVAAR